MYARPVDEVLTRYADVLAHLREFARDPAFGQVQFVTDLGGAITAADFLVT